MKRMSFWSVLISALLATTALIGCSDADFASNAGLGGEFGATQGGVQDMGLARELIASGQVPPAGAFTVEGMFSEHDLPLQGEACETLLCLRYALGVAPDLSGEPSAWLQVGLSSTIDPVTHERPSLTLIATVDVSGSMGWGYGSGDDEYPKPSSLAQAMLRRVAAQLGEGDRIAIVTYGSDVKVKLGLTQADDQERIQAVVDGLDEGGSTHMEAGMLTALDLARQAVADRATEQVRVMLFTDVQPNVGATSPTEFQNIAADMANEDIGLTVMGVGVGMGAEVLNALVNLRGGNAFSLFHRDDPAKLMVDSWPWMVSPIAYDLAVQIQPNDGIVIGDAYGFPGEHRTHCGFQVATVFLSKRRGGLLIRLVNATGGGLTGMRVAGELSYTTPAGEHIAQDIEAVYFGQQPDDRGMFFEQAGVAKTTALAILVDNMKAAAEDYGDHRQAAVRLMHQVVERFADDAQALDDPALLPELELARDLLDLMEQGAPQGDLYGQY